MSKFRNWLEEWFGIPVDDDHGSDATITTPIVSERSSEFHVLRVQPTPNPNAFQFVINAPIISTGTKTFTNTDEAKGDSLAEALFQIYGVENIYLKESFVTITQSETVGWYTVFEKILPFPFLTTSQNFITKEKSFKSTRVFSGERV